jgi:hypothetical protein
LRRRGGDVASQDKSSSQPEYAKWFEEIHVRSSLVVAQIYGPTA